MTLAFSEVLGTHNGNTTDTPTIACSGDGKTIAVGQYNYGYAQWNSIGIAYAGGVSDDLAWKDTRNKEQKETLLFLLTYLKTLFPKVEIYGHRDFSAKECPSFDAREEYKHI